MTQHCMVIDLNRCTRCRTCYITCKREYRIAAQPRDSEHPYEYYRLRYVEWEWGKYPMTKRAFIPIACMQCKDPMCANFCALNAISPTSEGIFQIDKNMCNGCGVCAAVCPYGAILIDFSGKADGCDFCSSRVEKGLVPKCVETCPGRARSFGDLDDQESRVSIIVGSGKARPLLLPGVEKTKVYYVPSSNEGEWCELRTQQDFLMTLAERKKDLPPVRGVV